MIGQSVQLEQMNEDKWTSLEKFNVHSIIHAEVQTRGELLFNGSGFVWFCSLVISEHPTVSIQLELARVALGLKERTREAGDNNHQLIDRNRTKNEWVLRLVHTTGCHVIDTHCVLLDSPGFHALAT